MKIRLKKIGALLLASILTLGNICTGNDVLQVNAAKTQCASYKGGNLEAQHYDRWSKPVKSYLEVLSDDNLMRVQAGAVDKAYLVEYYDAEYNIEGTKIIAEELPIFGGFYAMGENYYILSGQENPSENPDVECYRITKYDKDWNRISSAGLYDCNTTIPFDAGSARFTECGKYLLIRTCHEMYKTEDGYNHQANVTIQLDTDTMSITDSYTKIMNKSYGYVSHSFNQFIKIDDNRIVAMDHGDANPRSLVLIKYKKDVTTGKFVPGYSDKCDVIDLLKIQGQTGNNDTGTSLGGFEISESSYLAAYNSIDQVNGTLEDETRNIYVAAYNKENKEITTHQITNFAEGEAAPSTPHLVKISDNDFMVLWSENKRVSYVKIDGQGNQQGNICYIDSARLSDCVPVVLNGQLVWYTWNNEVITFYSIELNDITKNKKTVIENGHEWECVYPENGSNVCVRKCLNCDHSEEIIVPSSFSVYWNTDGGNSYSTWLDRQRSVGDSLKFWIIINDENVENEDFDVSISDENIAEVDYIAGADMGKISCKGAGKFTITVTPKYNPAKAAKFEITVVDPNATPSPTETEAVTPSPTETEAVTPSPTETEEVTPSPTETEEVTPTPTQTEEVTPTPTQTENVTKVFTDVYADWYKDYVQYVYDNGLMTGIKGTTQFAPNANITKAQVAQVLYNMEEKPTVVNQKVFTELRDVYESEWYANAVAWAYNHNIVTGDLNTKKFNPNADVTREQLALMMYRYAKFKEYNTEVTTSFEGLVNADKVADWSMDGVKWAVGSGLISGIEKNGVKDLAPQGNASRAQVAAILKRFCEKYE